MCSCEFMIKAELSLILILKKRQESKFLLKDWIPVFLNNILFI